MELRQQTLEGELLHPAHAFAPVPTRVEIRWDPLTGHTSRLVRGGTLMPRGELDLPALADQTRENCPFCADRITELTPRISPRLTGEGRITRGEAILFPNLLSYAQYSAVSVYSPRLHFLPLAGMTTRLVADNLSTQVAFARAVMRADARACWNSVNVNHLVPSGSSVFHPHMQGSVDPVPSTMQRLLAAVPGQRMRDYVETERRLGVRYLGRTGAVEWLASFAPVGPCELRAFVAGAASPVDLTNAMVEELGHGIATAFRFYAELGFDACNLAIYGAPPGTDGYVLNLRMVCRSNLRMAYRSDATYLERLHWEAAVDLAPEELAERAGDRFRG